MLREAYRRTRKDSAPGIDGVTAEQYAAHLEENLRDLHERLRSGRYQAPPVKRHWLSKAEGSQRPIGLPTCEDKIVQRAVTMLLGAIYEEDFHAFSYGFRPGRSAHQARSELRHIPSTLHQNPTRLWDLSRSSTPITPCGGSNVKSSACVAVLNPTSFCACRTAPVPRLP